MQQVQILKTFAQTEKVTVTFNKAGHGKSAVKVNNLRFFIGIFYNIIVATQSENSVGGNSDSCNLLIFFIRSKEMTIFQDEVCVCFFGSGTGNQEQQKKKNGIFHGDIWFKKMPTLPEQRGQGLLQ
jgi:hypothetical protein